MKPYLILLGLFLVCKYNDKKEVNDAVTVKIYDIVVNVLNLFALEPEKLGACHMMTIEMINRKNRREFKQHVHLHATIKTIKFP